MTNHKRIFHKKIDELVSGAFAMSGLAKYMINESVGAFIDNNNKKALEIIKIDDKLDRYFLEIENKGIQLLATQQPMAKDLRYIAGILRIIVDIERLGDYSVDIAKGVKYLKRKVSPESANILKAMLDIINKMLDDCMEPISSGDIKSLEQIVKKDDIVDKEFKNICAHVVKRLGEKNSKDEEQHEISVLLAGRHMERIADHITNICERVYYIVNGDMVELHKD